MKKFIGLLILITIIYSVQAQNIIIGRVIDAETGNPLPGTDVFLLEQNMGTIANELGDYKLENIPNGKLKIQYSFIGYKTVIKTILIAKQGMQLDISLEPTIIHSQEVVISGGTFSSQHENAIKIETIKAKQLNNLTTTSFCKALSSIPGVDMIAKGHGISKPVIRGLSMTNILMLNNGVKMENFQFSENHPFLVDEFGIEKVEIIKGPASLLYGSDAVGGVINLIKEKPAPMDKIIGDYILQAHSNTNGFVSNFGLKGNHQGIFWGIRAGIKSHEDYLDGKNDYIPNSRFNSKSLKLQSGIIKPYGAFKLYYDYNEDKLGMSIPASISLITKKGRRNDIWYQDLNNHLISSKNKLFIKNYKIDLNTSLQLNNRCLNASDLTPAFKMVDMKLTTFTYEAKTNFPSDENSEYILGAQGMFKNNKNGDAPNHVIPDANVKDISFFGLIQKKYFKKLQTQIGIRYDIRHISTKEETNKPKVENNYNNLSFSIGATYNITSKILIRSNIASAYRSPNIAELTQNGIHGDRYEQGNPNLNAQRSYEADLSIHYHSEYITFDIAAFYNSINDYIYLNPTNDTTSIGELIYKYSQTNAYLYGSETGINIFPKKWLNFIVTFSNVIGKQHNNNYLPFIPQNKLKIETKISKDKLSFINEAYCKLGAIFAFKQNKPGLHESKTDHYNLVQASIGGKIKYSNQMIAFDIVVNNILNEYYYDHLSTLKEIGLHNMGRNISINLYIPINIK